MSVRIVDAVPRIASGQPFGGRAYLARETASGLKNYLGTIRLGQLSGVFLVIDCALPLLFSHEHRVAMAVVSGGLQR